MGSGLGDIASYGMPVAIVQDERDGQLYIQAHLEDDAGTRMTVIRFPVAGKLTSERARKLNDAVCDLARVALNVLYFDKGSFKDFPNVDN